MQEYETGWVCHWDATHAGYEYDAGAPQRGMPLGYDAGMVGEGAVMANCWYSGTDYAG